MRTVDRFKTGNSRNPTLSPSLVKTVEEAWLAASLEHNAAKVRSGHVVMALLSDKALARQTKESAPELHKISLESLEAKFHTITDGSPEDEPVSAPGSGGVTPAHGTDTTSPNLDKYTEDLTARANAGQIDAIVGRDDEVRQMIDILMHRRQNSPILTGEAGVGKTAVVEGFAVQLAKGDVPPPLQNVCIRALDLALFQAGAGVKGEFENRLRSVIDEVKASPTPIILFIDEAHTLVGAGGPKARTMLPTC